MSITKKQFIQHFSATFYKHKTKDITCRNTDNEILNNLFQKIHDTEFMPDDFKYETIESLLSNILEYDINFKDTLRDSLEDRSHEIIDGLVSVYNHDRLQWLSSHLKRASYIDNARDEGLINNDLDEFERIGIGMYCEIEELYNNMINTLDNYFETEDITE